MSFNNLSLNVIEQVYLKLEPDDIANLCEVHRKQFKNEFCQNQDFWKRYFLHYRRKPPPKFDIFQYYSNQFYKLELVNKCFSFINDNRASLQVSEIYKLNYDLFKKLDFVDQKIFREFFENQGKEEEHSNITLIFDVFRTNSYFIDFVIWKVSDKEGWFYDPYFDKRIDVDGKQLKELIKILLMANVKFLDNDTNKEIEFED